MNYRVKTNIERTIIYIILLIVTIMCIVPIWLLLVNSTRSTPEIQSGISLLPSNNLIVNYKVLTGRGLNIWRAVGNSFFISVFSTAIGVYLSLMTAYGLKVYIFKGQKFLTSFILMLVLVPMQTSIFGFYQYMSKLGLLNSYIPLILPAGASAATVFFALQYLDSIIIKDLIHAARIDGCSEFMIFQRVMLPIAAPGIFTLSIFGFVASWNNFFTPFILISKMEKYTLPMLVQTLRGDVYKTELGGIYLGLAMSILPILIVYSIFAKYIVSGIAMGAVKE